MGFQSDFDIDLVSTIQCEMIYELQRKKHEKTSMTRFSPQSCASAPVVSAIRRISGSKKS